MSFARGNTWTRRHRLDARNFPCGVRFLDSVERSQNDDRKQRRRRKDQCRTNERLAGQAIGLTLDVGHLHCQGEVPIVDGIRAWSDAIVNVHLEDMRAGVHEHLMFGHGEIEFPPVLRALGEVGYGGGVYVELSRHSHRGPEAARQAIEFLTPLVG